MMQKDSVTLITRSEKGTYQLGEKIALFLHEEDVVALYGDLGSGKTVLIQGICKGLHVRQYVTSPTFALVHEYLGDYQVFHFDFYRLDSPESIEQLDLDGYLNRRVISLIECAERAEIFLPKNRFSIHLDPVIENEQWLTGHRRIHIDSPRSLESLKAPAYDRTGY